jgi:hypothetical protein
VLSHLDDRLNKVSFKARACDISKFIILFNSRLFYIPAHINSTEKRGVSHWLINSSEQIEKETKTHKFDKGLINPICHR